MIDVPGPTAPTLEVAAARLAALLTGGGTVVRDPLSGDLAAETDVTVRPLSRAVAPPADVWAVAGGMATVVDARCLSLLVTRAATVRFRHGVSVLEDEGELRAHLLGAGEARAAVDALGLGVAPDASLEGAAHLLRDGGEWRAVERAVDEADEGALVLVDGDLQPDWRIPSRWAADLHGRAAARNVVLAGVTKHSSLMRGGAPLVGALELEAAASLGDRATWWAPVARTRPDLAPGLLVVVARLDPDARYAFRIDLPTWVDPEPALAALAAVSDDAAFPGYPYALSVADRIAACPGWLREEVQFELDDLLDRLRVPWAVRDRAFADRHRLMERA
jgi:hypothetical protein